MNSSTSARSSTSAWHAKVGSGGAKPPPTVESQAFGWFVGGTTLVLGIVAIVLIVYSVLIDARCNNSTHSALARVRRPMYLSLRQPGLLGSQQIAVDF